MRKEEDSVARKVGAVNINIKILCLQGRIMINQQFY